MITSIPGPKILLGTSFFVTTGACAIAMLAVCVATYVLRKRSELRNAIKTWLQMSRDRLHSSLRRAQLRVGKQHNVEVNVEESLGKCCK